MEFKRTESPTRPPGCCIICKTPGLPCAEIELEWVDVPTADGIVTMAGMVYVCLDHGEYAGCASQMSRLGGGLDARQAEELRAENRELREALARSEGGVERLRDTMLEVLEGASS